MSTPTPSCNPPEVNFTKQFMSNVDLKAVGIVEEKNEQVLRLKFLKSNKFWDESDIFHRGKSIPIYRVSGDENVAQGEAVLLHINGVYWDAAHVTELDDCAWTYNTLQASSIQPYTFDSDIFVIESLKQSFFLVLLLPFLLLFLTVWLEKKFKFKSKK